MPEVPTSDHREISGEGRHGQEQTGRRSQEAADSRPFRPSDHEEGILHVQLVDRPVMRDCNAEDDADRGLLDHQTEGLIVVDVVLLGEATNHPARLVAGKRAIDLELMAEDLLARHDVGARRTWDEAPGVIVAEGLVLVNYRSAPIGVGEGAAIVCRYG
jgi:hypothetical protein